MVHRQVKGFYSHTLGDHALTRKLWQVPFPGSCQRQNRIHYDTTLLPHYYTVLSKEVLSTAVIGSPGNTVLVKIPSLMPFVTRSIGA